MLADLLYSLKWIFSHVPIGSKVAECGMRTGTLNATGLSRYPATSHIWLSGGTNLRHCEPIYFFKFAPLPRGDRTNRRNRSFPSFYLLFCSFFQLRSNGIAHVSRIINCASSRLSAFSRGVRRSGERGLLARGSASPGRGEAGDTARLADTARN
jgi:hypothetical protein